MRVSRATTVAIVLSLILGCGGGGDDDGSTSLPTPSSTATAAPTESPLPSLTPTPTPSFEEVVLAVATRFGPVSPNDGGTFRQFFLRHEAGTWESVSLAPTVVPALRGITFASPRVAYAFGGWGEDSPGVLVRSDDAGRTWRSLGSALPAECRQIFDAVFADEEAGYVVARSTFTPPAVFRTTDGGASWLAVPIPPSLGFPLYGAYALGIRAGAAELIRYDGGGLVDVRLDDAAAPLVVVESPGGPALAGANALSTAGAVGWIAEAYGASILRSDRPGTPWERLRSDAAITRFLRAIDVRDDHSGVAGGGESSTGPLVPFLLTTDDGTAWHAATVAGAPEGAVTDVLRLRGDAAIAIVDITGIAAESRLLRSSDGGRTWQHDPTRFERDWWIHDLARNTARAE